MSQWRFINQIQFCKYIIFCIHNTVIIFVDESMVEPPHSQPWMVAFVPDVPSDVLAQRQVCTGTLVDGSKVLTAASCDVRYLSRGLNINNIGKNSVHLTLISQVVN